jgi:hypothetical protein
MQEKLTLIAENLKKSDAKWFEEQGIIVKEKGDFWILNYHQFATKTPYNVLTRGLVIHKDGRVVSCPFFRFFNYGEPTAANVDFSNSDIMEKLDGSLVVVCFPERDMINPVWHFRSLISTHQKDVDFAIKGFLGETKYPLLMSVYPYIKQIKFPRELEEYSLMFEFISRANALITRYEPEQYGLYLIGARHLPSLNELTEVQLDDLAGHLGIRRPRRWNADSYDEVLAMMANFAKDYEGFVVRDRKTGERIKIKSKDYVERHHLLSSLSYTRLIPRYFEGERGEIEAYIPQSKAIFDKIEEANNNFTKKVLDVLLHWQSKDISRKEVALGIVGKEPRHVCSVVFKLLDVKSDQEVAIKKIIKEMHPPTLIEAWGLKDELVEEVVQDIIT